MKLVIKKNKKIVEFEDAGPIKKILLLSKGIFSKTKPLDLSLTEDEQDEVEACVRAYKESDEQLFKYNIEENIVRALTTQISGEGEVDELHFSHRYDASVVPGLLKESVIPDLKKLGLEKLIPELKKSLAEAYKKDVPDPKSYQIKNPDIYKHTPDFPKEIENNNESIGEDDGIGIGED